MIRKNIVSQITATCPNTNVSKLDKSNRFTIKLIKTTFVSLKLLRVGRVSKLALKVTKEFIGCINVINHIKEQYSCLNNQSKDMQPKQLLSV